MNTKTKWIAWVIVIAIIIVVVGYVQKSNKEQEKIKIGVIAPISGVAANLGEWMMVGINMAKDEINNQGGINGKKIELVIEDDKCVGKTGIDAYKKLTAFDKVNYIIGPLCLAVRIPVLKTAENDKVLIVTTGLSHSSDQTIRRFTFNPLPSVAVIADKILDFAVKDLGYTKIAFLYSSDEYGLENEIAVNNKTKELGVEITTAEKYSRGTNDLRTQILKIKNDDSQAVLMTGFPSDYAVFLKQAKELGLNKQILAGSVLQAPDVAKVEAETGQKVYYSYPLATDFPSVKSFNQMYKEKYPAANTAPLYVSSGYDAIKLLVNALSQCKTDDINCVEKVLAMTKDYAGANGPVTFDNRGNNIAANSIEIKVLEDGKFKKLSTAR